VYRRNPRADAERVTQVLAGLDYPAAKWQILMHAESYGADAFTRAELWALPTGEYADLDTVLMAVRDGAVRDKAVRDVAAAGPAPAIPRQRGPQERGPQVVRYPPPYAAPLRRTPGYRRQPAPQVAGRTRPLR
jgi:hypothetical protein